MNSLVVVFISLFAFAFFVLVFCVFRSTKKKQIIASKVRLLLVICTKYAYSPAVTLTLFGKYMWSQICST